MGYRISILSRQFDKIIRLRACVGSVMVCLQEFIPDVTIQEQHLGNRWVCDVHLPSEGGMLSYDKEVRKRLSEGLAEYICECQEPEMIQQIIRQQFKYGHDQDLQAIEEVARRLLEGSAWEYAQVVYVNRRQKLAKQISGFLRSQKEFAVDGFVRFRLQSYRKALSQCVKEAVAEYLVDQEYQEFISLLRSFLSVQRTQIHLVHVLHTDKGEFRLLKEDGTPLKLKEIDGIFRGVMEQSKEDFIVSTLLTMAPECVILHTKHPGENLLRTLMQIFRGRIVLCCGCSHCGVPFQSLDTSDP